MRIVTHNGSFHPDEIFAIAVIVLANGEAEIVRSRDKGVAATGDFIVDVGGEYDGERKFDHHQGGIPPRKNGIPYASFGLVWKKFGAGLCGSEKVAVLLDKTLIQGIDATDNGIMVERSNYGDVFTYPVWGYMKACRPTWKEDPSGMDAAFLEQVEFAKRILGRTIKVAGDEEDGKQVVEQAYRDAVDKRVVVLDKHVPWEEVLASHPEPLFAVYPGLAGDWSAQAARSDLTTYVNRKDFPAEWAGLRDEELAKATGVPDAVFCHRGRFFIVAKTKEGAQRLARLAVEA